MMDFINYAFFYLILQLVLCESRFVPSFEKKEYIELSTTEGSEIGLPIDRDEELNNYDIANTATPATDETSSMTSYSSSIDAENTTAMAENSTVTEMELSNFLPENDTENVTDSSQATDEMEFVTSTTLESLLETVPYELDDSVSFEESFGVDVDATTSDGFTDISPHEESFENVSIGSYFGIVDGSEFDRRLLNQGQELVPVSDWSSDADREEEEQQQEKEEEFPVEEEKEMKGNKSTSDIIDNEIDETDRGCGIPSSGHRSRKKRVVGGTRVIYGQIPWLVSLRFRGTHPFINRTGFNHLCGASLINSHWLLSTAHCFSTKVPEHDNSSNTTFWYAVIGGNSLAIEEKTEKRVEIAKIIVHENFTFLPMLRYDVALLKLSEPIAETQHIKYICLDQKSIITPGEMCTVAGWGVHAYEGNGGTYPFQTTLNVLSQYECEDKIKHLHEDYRIIYSDYETNFCALSDKVQDACQGDSGGPFQCYRNGRWYLIGLISAGYECGNLPGVYAGVAYVIDWINEQMKQQ